MARSAGDRPSRTYYPRGDVKIVRDAEWGVPHIYGLTDAAAAFGAGYAAVEDRLPIIMALNALGRAEAFELLGDNASWLADAEIVRLYGYTDEEFQAMIDRLPVVYGQDGQDLVDLLDELDGRHERGARADPARPVPAAARRDRAGRAAGPFRPTDIVVDRVDRARALRRRRRRRAGERLPDAVARRPIRPGAGPRDLRGLPQPVQRRRHRAHDRTRSPTARCRRSSTELVAYPSQYSGGDPGVQVFFEQLLAMFPGGMAQASHRPRTWPSRRASSTRTWCSTRRRGRIDLSHPGQLSNHVVVDGEASSTGHPILLGGPQAGYFDPQILVENELHGDRIHARGASFPGMGFVVIGRNAEPPGPRPPAAPT